MVPKICSVDGCDKQEKPMRRRMCRKHYSAWHYRTPLSERTPAPAEDRFWARVERGAQDECWNWQGPAGSQGYGTFNIERGKTERTHRIALQFKLGRPLLPGAYACHTCDNRMCVNPHHLYEGTHQTNIADTIERARHSRGASHPISKLTDDDVILMRHLAADGAKNRDLAARFGIKEPTVTAITHGNSWAHLGGPRSFKQKQKPKRKKAA